MEKKMAWDDFGKEVRSWISENPEVAHRLLQEALSQIPANSLIEEAQWAARWARRFWATAGVEPPR